MKSKFFFSLNAIKPSKSHDGGSITSVTCKDVPGFVNVSFMNLQLNKRGALEPIWHPNASKLGYCTEGNVLVSIRTPHTVEIFTVKKGEIFFIPQGYVHHIENISEARSSINFVLNHILPETMVFSKAVQSISDSVFTSTFNTPAHFVDGLTQTKDDEFLKILTQLQKTPSLGENRYKFDIEGSKKVVMTKGGYLQVGTKTSLSTLQGLGILGFGLKPKGCVEPHWHTNAGELIYIVKGKTRITVLSPDGNDEVLEVNGGEGAFAPASHFHNIENIGTDDAEVIAFFSHELPDYIGIGEVLGSYSNELLSSIFNTPSDYFDNLQKTDQPLVIVPMN